MLNGTGLAFSVLRILFVHCNYPAQFRHLSKHSSDKDNEIAFLCQNKELIAESFKLRLVRYQLGREPKGEFVTPTYDVMKLPFYTDKQRFEKHFVYDKVDSLLI